MLDDEMADATNALSKDIEEDWEVSPAAAIKMTTDYLEILGSVKNEKAFVSGFNTGRNEKREREEAVKFWLDTVFFRRDLPVVIRARNGRGKTYLLTWLLLRTKIMRPDGDFLTNIPWFWETDPKVKPLAMPNFYNINKMSDMLRRSSETVLEGRTPYVIIDEMDNAVSSQDFTGGRGGPFASWKQFTYIKRHLKMKGPLLAYHSVNDIPNYMRSRQVVADILKVYVHGGERYVFSKATRPYRLKVGGDFVIYSKNGFNDFEIDVDMRKLRVSIGKTGTPAESARKILANLDSCTYDAYEKRKEEFDKGEMYKDICEMKAEGQTYREIQEKMKISAATVKKALEWCEKQQSMKGSKENDEGDDEIE
ncbi:MAG: hypothetical protein LVQ63_07060 [Thermoplasmatales archaeon]|nr:hypothetical protein [Thermoplasmatales archaeon]